MEISDILSLQGVLANLKAGSKKAKPGVLEPIMDGEGGTPAHHLIVNRNSARDTAHATARRFAYT